jgi:hypothetical protein
MQATWLLVQDLTRSDARVHGLPSKLDHIGKRSFFLNQGWSLPAQIIDIL